MERKRLSVYEMIQALLAQGHNVEYYVRPAEKQYAKQGYRITRVDGNVFATSNAEGNQFARAMLKPAFRKAGSKKGRTVKLSVKETRQRRRANPMTELPKLTKRQASFMRKINREIAKSGKKGYYNQKLVRKKKKAIGWKSAAQSMRNVSRLKKGYAYAMGVKSLIDVIDSEGVMPKTSAYLKRHLNTVNEIALADAWDIHYQGLRKAITWQKADEKALARLKEGRDQILD